MKKFMLLAVTALCLASCSTVRKTADVVGVDNTVHNYPVIADMQVSPQRVTQTVEWRNGLVPQKKVEEEKGNLVADLLAKAGGDVLLEPQFIHESDGVLPRAFRHHKITVTGFVGTYKNFHKATPEDLKALQMTQGVMPNKPEKMNEGGNLLKKLIIRK
ncbi:MAG: hypothetical protein IJ064_01920 [Bacteroidaceae bacterium]|nr:hypothetical protein [Bacteroidaceae bacterium]